MTNLIAAPLITTPEIERAEKAVLDAKQIAADLKLAAAAREERLKHLRARRAALAVRLGKLQSRDTTTARAYYKAIIADLLDTNQVEVEHARKLELSNAFKCISELDTLDEVLPAIVATVKAELVQADAALAEIGE